MKQNLETELNVKIKISSAKVMQFLLLCLLTTTNTKQYCIYKSIQTRTFFNLSEGQILSICPGHAPVDLSIEHTEQCATFTVCSDTIIKSI